MCSHLHSGRQKFHVFFMTKVSAPTTVWKFQDFSVIQILREINFGESRSSKTAVFAILGRFILLI